MVKKILFRLNVQETLKNFANKLQSIYYIEKMHALFQIVWCVGFGNNRHERYFQKNDFSEFNSSLIWKKTSQKYPHELCLLAAIHLFFRSNRLHFEYWISKPVLFKHLLPKQM